MDLMKDNHPMKEREEEKSQVWDGFGTHDLLVMMRVGYHCASTDFINQGSV